MFTPSPGQLKVLKYIVCIVLYVLVSMYFQKTQLRPPNENLALTIHDHTMPCDTEQSK